jgi:hypothetical protein
LKPEKMPILQEFVKRGLGEGDLKNIEIVGTSFEKVKERFASAVKTQKKTRPKRGAPQTWGGQTHQAMKSLVREGFFNLPNKKTREDLAKALETRGIPTEGKKDEIASILARRVKRGVLKVAKESDGWVYWTE